MALFAAREAAHAPSGRDRLLGHGAAALFALLIAGSFSIGGRAAPHIDPGALNALRFAIAAVTMGIVVQLLAPHDARRAVTAPKAVWRYGVLGALMGFYFVMMFTALKIASPVSTGAVLTLMPLISAGLAFAFTGQRAGPMVLACLAAAAAGAVWVIFRGDVDAILGFDIGRGEAVFLLGVTAHAAYNALVRPLNRGEPVLAFTFWTVTGTALCLLVYAAPAIARTDWAGLPAIVWACIAYVSTFATAATYFLMQYALMRIPAAKATAYILLTPGYVILIEGVVGAGWASPSVMAGAVVTIAALAALVFAPEV